jgi:hypothetical protein
MSLHYISIKGPRGRHKSPETARKCGRMAWVRTQLPVLEIGFGNKQSNTPVRCSREESECSQGRQGQDCTWQRTTGFLRGCVRQVQSCILLSMRTLPSPSPSPFFQKTYSLDKLTPDPWSVYMLKTITTLHRHLCVMRGLWKCFVVVVSFRSTNDNSGTEWMSYCASFFFFFFFFGFWFFETGFHRVSLYSPGCPSTHFVVQAGLELRNPPASAFQVLGLKACAITPGCLSISLRPAGLKDFTALTLGKSCLISRSRVFVGSMTSSQRCLAQLRLSAHL